MASKIFTPEQKQEITKLYLSGTHQNDEICKILKIGKNTLYYAIQLFELSSKFKQKFGMIKTQYMIQQKNIASDSSECPHTGKDAIEALYVAKGLSAPVIAVKLGLTLSQVKFKIKKYGLIGKKTFIAPPPKEHVTKDITRRVTRDFRVANKAKSKEDLFTGIAQDRSKVSHLLESDISTLDVIKLTPITCRGINTDNGKDTFCLAQIEPSHTYCQHHKSIYYTKKQA
jgi:DNA-binding CsgD family transcriptional regulator